VQCLNRGTNSDTEQIGGERWGEQAGDAAIDSIRRLIHDF
jgi:hypothetical protein